MGSTNYKRHGLSKHPLYRVWKGMKHRCNNPNSSIYKYYGGRGIKVCKEWEIDFMTFYEWAINNGYKKGLTIDRINNNSNYEPWNCRFATRKMQLNNTRKTLYIKYRGGRYSSKLLFEKLGIPKSVHYTMRKAILEKGIQYAINRYKYM